MICKTCKFWGDPDYDNGSDGTKQCIGIKMYSNLTYNLMDKCGQPKYVNDQQWKEYIESDRMDMVEKKYKELKDKTLKDAKAYVQDGSDYWAALFTQPNFGCALWTKK